jgi:hypothetical protein
VTARYGCTDCGVVVNDDNAEAFCFCEGDVVPLPTAADVLAFRLRMGGRGDEAERVEQDVATLQEHRRGQ